MKLELNGIQIKIIHKLFNRGKWGAGHSPVDNIVKGFRSDLGSEVNEAFKNLVKIGIIITGSKNGDLHGWLNRDKLDIISKIDDWFADNLLTLKGSDLTEVYAVINE